METANTAKYSRRDETPWVVKGVKEWLWIFAHTNFGLFHAADTRSRLELETILGLNYSGVLSSEDYSVDNGYDVKARAEMFSPSTPSLEKTHPDSRFEQSKNCGKVC